MKKYIFFTALILALSGCSQSVDYNPKASMPMPNEGFEIDANSLFVYAPQTSNKTYKASSKIGADKNLNIDIVSISQKTTFNYLKNYSRSAKLSNDSKILNSNSLIILPEISNFSFGYKPTDVIEVDVKPFVSYDLKIKIIKNKKVIFDKLISKGKNRYSQSEFIDSAMDYNSIGILLQESIANDLKESESAIISAINNA